MADYGQSQMCKISLKSFPNAVIEHDLVTIRLRMDWLEKNGEDPSLIIFITNKNPPNTYFPRNQSSVMVNAVHHHHQFQHQEGHPPPHPQRYYHSSTMNNYEPSSLTSVNASGDHSDISSMTTTTTVVYNSVQPQYQPSSSAIAIQKIACDLKSQVASAMVSQPTIDPSYTSSQLVIQTPVNNMNDPHSDRDMFGMNTPSSAKYRSSMTDSTLDFAPSMNTPSPSLPGNNLNLRSSVVCTCPDPMTCHDPECPTINIDDIDSFFDFPSESLQQSPNNRMNMQQGNSYQSVLTPNITPLPSITELTNSTSAMSFPNQNLFRTMDHSSNGITAIVAHPPFPIDNTYMDSTSSLPPINTIHNFAPQPGDVSRMFFNSQPNYPTMMTIPKSNPKPPKTGPKNPRGRKKSVKQNNLITSDQSLTQTQNDLQQMHNFTDVNSPANSMNCNFPSILSTPVSMQNDMAAIQDGLQHADQFLTEVTNNFQMSSHQSAPSPENPNVRSPVNLANLPPKSSFQITSTVDEIVDETITEVIGGKGIIPVSQPPTPIVPSPPPASQQQQQQRVSLTRQIVWEPIELVSTSRRCPSPINQKPPILIENLKPVTSNELDFILPNTSAIQSDSNDSIKESPLSPPTETPKKHALSTEISTPKAKRGPKLKVKAQPVTPTYSSSNEDVVLTKASSATASPNANDKPIPSTDTPMPSSETTILIPMEHSDQQCERDSVEVPDIDRTDNEVNNQNSNTELPLIIHPNDQPQTIDSDDLLSLKINNVFSASTPPPSLSSASEMTSSSTTNQVLPTVPKERSSSLLIPCKTENTYIYDFFIPNLSSSSSLRDENPTNSSKTTTSSTPRHQHSSDQQSCPVVDAYFNENPQSQAHPSPYQEKASNSTNSMNSNTTTSKSLKSSITTTTTTNKINSTKNYSSKYPTKLIREQSQQQQRFNPIRKPLNTKPPCTRCGSLRLTDITHHEFPKQRGLVFECTRCGNSSIRSNVSADERKRRMARIAADHLNRIECQFCRILLHSHNEYIIHLRDDHNSNKPM